MMLRPAIGDLLEKVGTKEKPGTRYSLVIATAKRARILNDNNVENKGQPANFVSRAVNEINDGTVTVILSGWLPAVVLTQDGQLLHALPSFLSQRRASAAAFASSIPLAVFPVKRIAWLKVFALILLFKLFTMLSCHFTELKFNKTQPFQLYYYTSFLYICQSFLS